MGRPTLTFSTVKFFDRRGANRIIQSSFTLRIFLLLFGRNLILLIALAAELLETEIKQHFRVSPGIDAMQQDQM